MTRASKSSTGITMLQALQFIHSLRGLNLQHDAPTNTIASTSMDVEQEKTLKHQHTNFDKGK